MINLFKKDTSDALGIEQESKELKSKEKGKKENINENEILSVSNISISFLQYTRGLRQNLLKVISDLTINVSEGEVVAILGSSGSGKSLLAHAILGILPSNANLTGNMKFEGRNLDQKLKEDLRGKEIALIPQSINFLDPLMKVADQVIGETIDEKDKKDKKFKQRNIFEKYGLGEEVDDLYPFQLSGGMARRVLVSTALLQNPKLVIADEPTPGLDDAAIEETLNNIKKMANDGIGVLLITHDINAALKVADKIAIFYSGYVIEIANVSEFSGDGENLKHPYTRALYKALPQNGFVLNKGHQPLHGELKEGCIYYDRCDNPTDICMKINPDLHELGGKKVRCHRDHRKYSG
ncbi:ABC transporter ATP-binding protein [Methanobrevibacter sp. TMH8]|uniref:oligopeptide/dipeptide ABC transporter ATP-binding protein n=1 Tax=Methanobrevibacter sp. TMH8 TaxID=2848611 RepID=UPI001CCA55DB|nr:ABC transporter ATP-binding protein [Methanobrevibacter sp. TMH8]MBZ9571428.1 ABC transporter ATP-binding protein [Methanobrevibacter sp. TMH8]